MFVFAECAAVLDLVCMGDGILILRRLYKQLQSGSIRIGGASTPAN